MRMSKQRDQIDLRHTAAAAVKTAVAAIILGILVILRGFPFLFPLKLFQLYTRILLGLPGRLSLSLREPCDVDVHSM